MISEFNEKVQEMKRIHENDLREKDALEDQVDDLKKSTQELTEKYEQRLRIKDDELFSRTQKELKEFQTITDTIKELETKLKQSDGNLKDLNQDYSGLQRNLEAEKVKNREYEQTLDSYQSKSKMNEEKLESMSKTLNLYEDLQNELKEELRNLRNENNQLKDSLVLFEENKKTFEADFREKIEDVEKVSKGA